MSYGIHAFSITDSDVPAYKIHYDMRDESYYKADRDQNVYIEGTNAADNPEFYEQGNTVTFVAPTRRYAGL